MTALREIVPLDATLEQARAAQAAWSGRPTSERLTPVRAFRRLLVESADTLCSIIGEEVGKKPAEVLGGEVLPVADACRFLERQANRLLRPRRVPGSERPMWLFGQSDRVYRRPRGVVGIIGTWNYPLFLNAIQILQALTAGNAVVWKPSEVTPRFAEQLHDLLLRAGYPAALMARLPATREAGPALAEADIDHIVFTGSESVGRDLAGRLGQRLVSSTLELSGCDALFVLEDADVELAARAAWFGTTINRGQTCIAVRRVFVARSLQAAFLEALKPLAAGSIPVALVLPSQVRQAQRLVEEARASGADLLVDPPIAAEGTFAPTVLVNVRPEMAICREASFAPIVAVLWFDTLEEALKLEAECPYALGAGVFTRQPERAVGLAARLRAGAITINDVIVPTAHPSTPFGGRGASGWGVTQGAEGLLEMTVPQVVSIRGGSFRPHYDLDDPRQEALVRGLLQATHASRWHQRLAGWWRLVRTFLGRG